MGQIVGGPKTTCKFKRRYPTHMGVILKMKFDTKQMLNHILVGASVKWRTETINRNDCGATARRLVGSMVVEIVFDINTTMRGCVAGWLSHHEPNILTTKVIVIAAGRD